MARSASARPRRWSAKSKKRDLGPTNEDLFAETRILDTKLWGEEKDYRRFFDSLGLTAAFVVVRSTQKRILHSPAPQTRASAGTPRPLRSG